MSDFYLAFSQCFDKLFPREPSVSRFIGSVVERASPVIREPCMFLYGRWGTSGLFLNDEIYFFWIHGTSLENDL